jgi:hypothetical protein
LNGKQNSVQLLETALVVEGYLLKVRLLGLETLFVQSLSEWTTVTVPYSRIGNARYSSFWPLRLGLLAAPFVFLALAIGMESYFGEKSRAVSWLAAPLAALGGISLFFGPALAWLIKPRYRVEYRAKDGKRTVFAFRIRSKKLRKEFDATLQRNRASAQGHSPVPRVNA